MKFFKWKTFFITSMVTVLPMFLGIALWNQLPDTMAIHFDINNNPDNFASKGFVVFCLPLLMVFLQLINCIINDVNAKKHGERKKFEMATKWIIPVMSIVLNVMTLGYGLGWNLDVRKVAAVLVAGVFLVIGNYMPKLDYVKDYDLATDKARKINRFIGYGSVIMGILFLISVFLPPVTTMVCIFLLIPYAIISTIYGIVVGKKKP